MCSHVRFSTGLLVLRRCAAVSGITLSYTRTKVGALLYSSEVYFVYDTSHTSGRTLLLTFMVLGLAQLTLSAVDMNFGSQHHILLLLCRFIEQQ